MAATPPSNNRRYQHLIVVSSLLLLLACIIGAAWVVIATESAFLAWPLVALSLGPARMLRWSMVWLSTPAEKKIFARQLEREPIVNLARAIFGRANNTPPAEPTKPPRSPPSPPRNGRSPKRN